MPVLPFIFTPTIPHAFAGLPDIPALNELKTYKQWVAWKIGERDGKSTKIPISPRTGYAASVASSGTWGTYEQAEARAIEDDLPGVGFVLTERDEFTGVDLDKCRDPETGLLEPWAHAILANKETYAEVSPSKTGVRMFWRGKVKATIKDDRAHVEIYRAGRYLTITGDSLPGPDSINSAPKTEAALIARLEQFRQPSPSAQVHALSGNDFFRRTNDLALRNLSAWVPAIFGAAAKFQFASGAYRISSKTLGRDLEEDLSISPKGIKDWGTHDIGDSRQGRRTAIDIVIQFGMAANVLDAARWLCERLNQTPESLGFQQTRPDPVAAESQHNLAAFAAADDEPPDPRAALDTSPLAGLAYNGNPYAPEAAGGVLGAIVGHILDTALFPVPDFACLSALTFASALYGRRWAEPVTGGGLNIYAIATAPTGWGKDHPLKEPAQLAYHCEMMHMMGPGEFKSDSSIEKTLRKCPVRACFMDEIGIVLQANASRHASSWERRVRKALLEVYSSSRTIWTGSQAAGDEDDKGSTPIHKPMLSFYGTSTPEELYKGLTEDNIRDGLFGRLIFAAPDEKPSRQKPGPGAYEQIKNLTEQVRGYTPDGIQSPGLYHAGLRNALIVPAQIRVPATRDASNALEAILNWQRDLTDRESDISTIANRAGENVGKLATLRALSLNHVEPEIELADVLWGWAIVERSLVVITRDIERHMVGSEFEGLVKAIRHHIEKAGKKGVSMSELNRARGVSKAHARDRDAAYRELEGSGDIVVGRPNNRGKRVWLARLFPSG